MYTDLLAEQVGLVTLRFDFVIISTEYSVGPLHIH